MGHHGGAELGHAGGHVAAAGEGDDGVDGRGVGDPQAVEARRFRESGRLAGLVNTVERCAAGEAPAYAQSIGWHGSKERPSSASPRRVGETRRLSRILVLHGYWLILRDRHRRGLHYPPPPRREQAVRR